MDVKTTPLRFTLGKQSSLAPEREWEELMAGEGADYPEEIDPRVKLMYLANEADLDGVKELLDSGIDVNFRDIDDRTALHVAACQGLTDVVSLLLERGADVDPKDRWGSTPLADAIYYKHNDVIKILEKRGAKPLMAPMHVRYAREVPEYEIDPKELDFTDSVEITKGTYRIASWRGIQVAVKRLGEEVLIDEDKVKAFRDELEFLQKIRHPNVVQFLGAVTQSSPMMIVTEYLPKGDLCLFLKRKGALRPTTAVRFALDIASCRGMSYLHENKPEAIIHRDLEPSPCLKQLKAATNDFNSANKIGEGGFGPVYKGQLPDGTVIAVKQLSSKSRQGNREFLNEMGMISCFQHSNLVKLHGCCIDGGQLLLVYEYMENNNLARALFGRENHLKLDWPRSRNICIGIARGLAFLHEESVLKIVHRDIKATNVLLDRDLNPKISDFGLAKLDEEERAFWVGGQKCRAVGALTAPTL